MIVIYVFFFFFCQSITLYFSFAPFYFLTIFVKCYEKIKIKCFLLKLRFFQRMTCLYFYIHKNVRFSRSFSTTFHSSCSVVIQQFLVILPKFVFYFEKRSSAKTHSTHVHLYLLMKITFQFVYMLTARDLTSLLQQVIWIIQLLCRLLKTEGIFQKY